jgi:hypothetical protein
MGRHYQSGGTVPECKEMGDYDYDDRHNGTDEIDLSSAQKIKRYEEVGIRWFCVTIWALSRRAQCVPIYIYIALFTLQRQTD